MSRSRLGAWSTSHSQAVWQPEEEPYCAEVDQNASTLQGRGAASSQWGIGQKRLRVPTELHFLACRQRAAMLTTLMAAPVAHADTMAAWWLQLAPQNTMYSSDSQARIAVSSQAVVTRF